MNPIIRSQRWGSLYLISVSLFIAAIVILTGCSSTSSVPAPAPVPSSKEGYPGHLDTSKVVVYSKADLEQGVTVSVPRDDIRIISFEIKPGERIRTFYMSSTLSGDLQAFFTDLNGNYVVEHPLARWQPGTYYLYIKNERLSSKSRKVDLTMRFETESTP